MPRLILALISVVALATAACAQDRYGEVYDPEADAAASIDAALADAQARQVPALIVFGANWCHDSRGLAHRLETDEALNAFMAEAYALVFVDVGERDRNLDQMARFDVAHIFGTPTLAVINSEGALLNASSVHHWRTVDNADPADIGAYLARWANAPLPIEPDGFANLAAVAAAWTPYQDAVAELETRDLSPEQRQVRMAYYEGFARSMARRELGLIAEAQGVRVVDLGDVSGAVADVADLTEDVIAALNDRTPDLVARGDRELQRYED